MTTIIFIWYLLTQPTDKDICTLWVNHQPTIADVQAACPPIDIKKYKLRIAFINSGQVACDDIPGEYLYEAPYHCRSMSQMWDLYSITIYEPDTISIICSVKIVHDGQPTQAEIIEQCPNRPAVYQLEYSHQETQKESDPITCHPPTLKAGPGLLDGADAEEQIATDENLYLLAGRLLWHGLAVANCNGWSGIDPATGAATTCGMESAHSAVTSWQNRYDNEIIAAASKWNVPPRLLKQLAIHETQMWPWNGIHGEIGLTQITDNGIDTTLFYYQPGYSRLTKAERHAARLALRASLDCNNCSAWQAAEAARDDWEIYASALAAYYCANDSSWENALLAWNNKHHIDTW
jgi:hypothetical protein